MLLALWIINGLLALAFLGAGGMKLLRGKDALAASGMSYVEDFSAGTVKLIGALEVLGAVGLIVPLLTGIVPVLTPIAAIGLAIIMIGAVVTHIRRKEPPLFPAILGVLAVASAVLGFIAVTN
ncbi:DoxX family protein [Serinicoccus marinus]|uniref:DoxX family protein n=1 Tax=Serinicoccus marinus TaxID=247333 RepID=UPI00040A0595|nr:DoxX family protein [Serinicoccus marinus]